MATHSSVLAWSIPWTEEPGGLQSMGSQGRKRPGRKQNGLERQLGTLTPTGFFFLIPPPPHTPTSRQNRRYGQNPRTAPALRRLLNRGCLLGCRLGLGRSWLPCAGAGNRRAEGQRQPPADTEADPREKRRSLGLTAGRAEPGADPRLALLGLASPTAPQPQR